MPHDIGVGQPSQRRTPVALGGLASPRRRPTVRPALDALATFPDPIGVRSLYLHVPFCFHKCHYCDFYSFVDRTDDVADRQLAFTDRLIDELRALAPFAGPLETIFVGGGTPTLLRVELWRRLLDAIHTLFDTAAIRRGEGEFTVECNPETASPELFDALAAGGVDRLSIGAQSFDPAMLLALERHHDPDNVARTLELARRAGIRRLSIDLIFAIPGQTMDGWLRDLDTGLALADSHGLAHLSAYSLTYEPRTTMTARLERGEFEPVDDALEAEMHAATLARTRAAGFERYEVSNHARPGQRCRHNLAYWRNRQWFAAGPSASGFAAGHRYTNTRAFEDYLRPTDDGLPPITTHEPPDPRRELVERIMLGLRLADGLDADALLRDAAAIDPGAPERLLREAASMHGRLVDEHADDRRRWRLTDEGFLLADRLAASLMACIGDGPADR